MLDYLLNILTFIIYFYNICFFKFGLKLIRNLHNFKWFFLKLNLFIYLKHILII